MKTIHNNAGRGTEGRMITDILKTAVTCLLPIHLPVLDLRMVIVLIIPSQGLWMTAFIFPIFDAVTVWFWTSREYPACGYVILSYRLNDLKRGYPGLHPFFARWKKALKARQQISSELLLIELRDQLEDIIHKVEQAQRLLRVVHRNQENQRTNE